MSDKPLTLADVTAAARGPLQITLAAGVRERMMAARSVVDAHLRDGIAVYGLNTGLGGNIGHRIDHDAVAAFQAQMVRARIAGIGGPLSLETCRAALFCRIAGLAKGGAGVSLDVFDLLMAMLAHDIVPVLPSRGSLGTGDLIMSMSMAAAVIGRGRVYFGGRIVEASDALKATGLAPVQLGAKDGLSVANASAVTTAMAALSLEALGDLLRLHIATSALAFEGYGANTRIFDPRLAAIRPAAGQEDAAALFRHALQNSSLHTPQPGRKVQDALSFRTLAQVTGTTLAAYAAACREVEIELNGAADNPLVLVDEEEIHSAANFHTPAIALAFDTLAISLVHLATASAQRSIKLMTGRLSGLPNYLSPVGGSSAGFVPMQKALAALQAEIRLKAAPASLDALSVSDTVEDVAPMTPLTITKLDEQIALCRWMITLEAMFAAQACSLRAQNEPDQQLGTAAAWLHTEIRAIVPALEEDRETGPDAQMLHDRLWCTETAQAMRSLFTGVSANLA
nr:aromatic amino acid ammonia-lyase [Tianweitania aestuarii]